MNRREFQTTAAGMILGRFAAAGEPGKSADRGRAVREALAAVTPKREWVDAFLDPKARVWAKFDPELGYLLRNYFLRDGAYGAHTLCRFETTGERKRVNFPDQPCRINTYGNSFTQGHQISDGETWQEVLSAHFCEPLRNYGIGGFGVYQAYRRLLRNEATDQAAPFLVFNIWGDDHLRSVYAWRALSFPAEVNARVVGGVMFHSNPWAHARLDPSTGDLVEKPNACPTPEALYNLCDPEYVYETFKDDEVTRCLILMQSKPGTDIDTGPLDRMAATIGMNGLNFQGDHATAVRDAKALLHAYAVKVGMKVMGRLKGFCEANGKKLFVLLSHPSSSVWHACNGSPTGSPGFDDWHPRVFQDFLKDAGIPFLDTLPKHVAEFKTFRLSPKEYVDRYYNGHYNPTGNHFFAYAVKDEILGWLDPKPPAYRGRDDETLIRFQGYLPS